MIKTNEATDEFVRIINGMPKDGMHFGGERERGVSPDQRMTVAKTLLLVLITLP